MYHSYELPGSTTIVTNEYWPIRIPSSLCGGTVYMWYYDKDNIYWYCDADTIHGMLSTVPLKVPTFTYTIGGSEAGTDNDYLLINDGNNSWHSYFMSSGELYFLDTTTTIDAWMLGGGGAGAGKSAKPSEPKENGQGGGGGGYRLTATSCNLSLLDRRQLYLEIGAGGDNNNTSVTGDAGGPTNIRCTYAGDSSFASYLRGGIDASGTTCVAPGGLGGRIAATLRGGIGGAGGSGGGGGGGRSHEGGAGGKNGADGNDGSGGSTDDLGRVINGGSGGAGDTGSSGYAFSDSTFDGIRRGDGGHGGGGMNKAYTRVNGPANTGQGGTGANGYVNTNTTAYYGGSGGSGLIILRNAS